MSCISCYRFAVGLICNFYPLPVGLRRNRVIIGSKYTISNIVQTGNAGSDLLWSIVHSRLSNIADLFYDLVEPIVESNDRQ